MLGTGVLARIVAMNGAKILQSPLLKIASGGTLRVQRFYVRDAGQRSER